MDLSFVMFRPARRQACICIQAISLTKLTRTSNNTQANTHSTHNIERNKRSGSPSNHCTILAFQRKRRWLFLSEVYLQCRSLESTLQQWSLPFNRWPTPNSLLRTDTLQIQACFQTMHRRRSVNLRLLRCPHRHPPWKSQPFGIHHRHHRMKHPPPPFYTLCIRSFRPCPLDSLSPTTPSCHLLGTWTSFCLGYWAMSWWVLS